MTLERLINCLNKLKPSNVYLAYNLLNNYKSNDWQEYTVNQNKPYSKKLIYENNLFDMYLISWNKNTVSNIHDHSNNGCILKVLQGKIIEDIYDENLNFIKSNKFNKNDISYIDNNIGYHAITNINNDMTYTLHIYSPPKYKTNYY